MVVALNGPWTESDIKRFLECETFPVRLACVGSDGFPRVVSLWYRYESGLLLCVTHRQSQLAGLLRQDGKVGFEVAPNEPPYRGLRGQGTASLTPLGGSKVLEYLLGRYLGKTDSSLGNWLLSRSDEELLITVQPHRIFSWDYRERMADAV